MHSGEKKNANLRIREHFCLSQKNVAKPYKNIHPGNIHPWESSEYLEQMQGEGEPCMSASSVNTEYHPSLCAKDSTGQPKSVGMKWGFV